jgi:hypothetical protein
MRRQRLTTYAVVVPFAIFLAFPFYFALVTMFKTNLDLGDVQHSPYVYNDLAGHTHWDFWNYATTEHVRFLFEDTNYPRWLLNTLLVGAAVVGITLILAMPAGYALARLAGGWGQSAGIAIFLVYLVPPTLLFLPLSRLITQLGLKDSLWALILVYPSFTVPFATWLLMGFFKTIPQEAELEFDAVSRLKALSDRAADLAPRDPHRRHLRLLALRQRVHLRVHSSRARSRGRCRRPERPHPRTSFLAVPHGGRPHPDDPTRAPTTRPRPLHQGLYRGHSRESSRKENCPWQRNGRTESRGSTLTQRPDQAGWRCAFAISMFGGLPTGLVHGPLNSPGLSGDLRTDASHFVPAYTSGSTTPTSQCEANDVEVKVDHINNALLYSTGASEAMLVTTTLLVHLAASTFRKPFRVTDLVQEVSRKVGPVEGGQEATYNPRTKQFYGFRRRAPDVQYRRASLSRRGEPQHGRTCERAPEAAIGHPVGLGMSNRSTPTCSSRHFCTATAASFRTRNRSSSTGANKRARSLRSGMRDIYERHVGRGLRLDCGFEQPGLPRRSARWP